MFGFLQLFSSDKFSNLSKIMISGSFVPDVIITSIKSTSDVGILNVTKLIIRNYTSQFNPQN